MNRLDREDRTAEARKERVDKGRKEAVIAYQELERAKHLRNLQMGMISKAHEPERKPTVYYVVSICMSALLIAATAWVIKWMLF